MSKKQVEAGEASGRRLKFQTVQALEQKIHGYVDEDGNPISEAELKALERRDFYKSRHPDYFDADGKQIMERKRDDKGRYTSVKERSVELRKEMHNAVTDDDWWAICRQLVEKARAGNLDAIKLLFDRVIGKQGTPHVKVEDNRQVHMGAVSNLSMEQLQKIQALMLENKSGGQ